MPAGSTVITRTRLAVAAEADPVLAYEMPDVEALVWSTISHLADDHGASVTSWSYSNDPVPASGPAGWSSGNSIEIDVRDQSKARAFRRADTARRLVMGLAGQPWSGGVVNVVRWLGGPIWQPDYDTGKPRYLVQLLVQVHPSSQQNGAGK